MDKFNAENERIKRDYAEFLREADQKSEATVRGIERAILRFEEYTGYCDFGRFSREQAKGFRAALSAPADESKRLGNSTVLSTLKAVQRFFRWLSVQPGFKSKIDTNAIAYFNLSEKDIRAATSSPTKPSPTMDQLKRALASMPSETILEKRDRAIFALLMMTGKRQVWSDSQPIRKIFKRAFASAGLPYFSPHRVRNTVVEYAYLTCRTPEEFKAFSQNLGHESVVTTLSSYGQIPLARQRELIRNAGKSKDLDAKLELLLEKLGGDER